MRNPLGLVLLSACVLCACGGIRIEGTTWHDVAAAVPSPQVSSWTLAASADVVVHDTERWESRNLSDETWLMAGADGTPSYWYAYVRFDLSQVPVDARVASAEITLTVEPEPPLPGDDDSAAFHVHVVHESWDERRITWLDQPLIGRHPASTFSVERFDGSAVDRVDVTSSVAAAMRAGAAEISFVIVPAVASTDLRRRWAATSDDDDEGTVITGPTLMLRAGTTPAPPTQAEIENRGR